jgi:phage-related protein
MARGPVLTVTLTADDDKLKGKLNGSSAEIEGWGKKVSGFAIGAGAAVTTMAISAIPQIIGMGAEMVGLGQQAELFNSKADTVFGESSGDIKKWADSVNESFGLSDEAVVGMAGSMGDLLVPMGFTRDAAAEMTQENLNAAGALSAWSGGQYDAAQVADIMTKAMLGETDGLKALGISINAAEVEQRALELAQKDGRTEVTAMDEALATQQLIMEKSTDAQAAWNDGTMDSVKTQNEMKATIADVKTSIGTAWIVNSFIPGVKNLVDTFKKNWPEIRAAVQPVLDWFSSTINDVVTVVTALWSLFGDNILRFATDTWNNVKNVIEGVMLVIKGIIDTVMGILTGDWEKAWGGIKGIVSGIWKAIEGIINQALNQIRTIISNIWTVIKTLTSGAWEGVKGVISSAIAAIVGYVTGIPGRIAGTISGLWEGLKSGITGAKDWIRDRINEIINFVRGIPGSVSSAVSGAFQAIPNAFRSAINGIIGAWNRLSFRIKGGPWDPLGAFGPSIPAVNFGFDTPDIGYLAKGTDFWKGGLAWVGEQGPELLNLPRGSKVTPKAESRRMASGGGGTNITMNFPAGVRADDVVQAQRKWEKRNGPR